MNSLKIAHLSLRAAGERYPDDVVLRFWQVR
jgi:hypothetical protein